MRHSFKFCSFALACLVALGLTACGSAASVPIGSSAPSRAAVQEDDARIRSFTDVLLAAYHEFGDEGVKHDDGSVFTLDLDGDGAKELFFRFETYKTSTVYAYRVAGDHLQLLGTFETASLIDDETTACLQLYPGDATPVLYTESILYGSAMEQANTILEYFVTLEGDALQIQRLERQEHLDTGAVVYFGDFQSTGASTATAEEYSQKKLQLLGEGEPIQEITLDASNTLHEFLQGDTLEQAVAAALQN